MFTRWEPGRFRSDWAGCKTDVIGHRPATPPHEHTLIHRANCRLITQLMGNAEPGGFTERGYIKVYADSIPPLRAWVTARRADGVSRECSRCLK